jgi:TetR/AcrR family transcriptional regulator, cholesterol catabolism regulator
VENSQTIVSAETASPRRQKILDVAADLFARRGFEATTLSDVARAAELKKATLYHYFPSKNAILLAVLAEGIDQLLENSAEAVAIADPLRRLDALLAAHLRNFEHKLAHVVVFLLERRVIVRDIAAIDTEPYLVKRRAYDRLFVDCIRDGQASGVFRDGDPVVLAFGLLGMLNWMVQWYDPNGRLTMEQIGKMLRSCANAAVAKQRDGVRKPAPEDRPARPISRH